MNNNRLKKCMSLFMTCCLILCSGLAAMPERKAVAKDYRSTTYVASIEDFKKLANICRYDTKSEDMLVVLTTDIDFTGKEKVYLPTFAGTFEGNGHTISGVDFTGSESPLGLFMTLQENGEIRNLNVTGCVKMADTTDDVGGIVGRNYGLIENCSFIGSVSGSEAVGGIVGENMNTGTVKDCSFSGVVFGKSKTGGIVGNNLGAIAGSKNHGVVNNVSVDPTLSLDDFEFDFQSTIQALTSLDTYNVAIDTGGIAGYSSGMILSSYNFSEIGYQHIGYNVGGIVGRSSGFINNCGNYGTIYGRKNIGGIAGILEPFTILNTSPDDLTNLRDQLNKLSEMVDSAISDAEGASSTISNRLKGLSASISSTADASETLTSQLEGYWNENVREVDRASLIVDDAVAQLDDVTEQLPQVSSKLSEGIKLVGEVSELGKSASGHVSDAMEDFENALSMAADAIHDMQIGTNKIQIGAAKLDEAFEIKDTKKFEEGLDFVLDGLSALSSSMNTFSKALENLAKVIADDKWADDFQKELDDMSALMTVMSGYMDKISEDLKVINDNLDIHYDENAHTITGAIDIEIGDAEALEAAIDDIMDTSSKAADTLSDMNDVMVRMYATLKDAGVWMDKVQAAAVKASSAFTGVTNSISLIDVGVQMIRENSTLDTASANEGIKQIRSGIESYTTSMAELEAAVRMMQDGVKDLGLAADDTEAALGKLSKAMDAFGEASDMMTGVLEGVKGLVDYLDGVNPVQFTEIGQDIEDSATGLYDAIDGISNQTDLLNRDAKNASDKILEDIREINEQVTIVSNLAIDMVFDVTGTSIEDKYRDTSEEDVNGVTYGRALRCSNNGYVYGDVAVGGIAGSMSKYDSADPEGDTEITINSVFHKKYQMKAVIQRCENEGKIVSKRNNVAGICGEIELGLIIGCSNYGKVISESGSNAGGIAGYSNSSVKNCYSKCTLSATKYVGGIIGAAAEDSLGNSDSSVSNCIAMVEIKDADLFYGAIAGDHIGAFEGNYYVSDTLAGINRISYENEAEGISYDAMTNIAGVPANFKSFALKFYANDELIDTVTFNYGDSLETSVAPAIPKVEGCYGVWDDLDYEKLHFDKEITAVYDNYTTALESSMRRDNGLPVIFVKGQFSDEATVTVEKSKLDYVSRKAPADFLHIEFDDDGLAAHQVRYLPAENKLDSVTTISLYIYEDGEWVNTEYLSFGSYLEFEMQGTEVDFCVVRETSTKAIILICVAAVVLIAVIVLIVVIRKKTKGKKANAKKVSEK